LDGSDGSDRIGRVDAAAGRPVTARGGRFEAGGADGTGTTSAAGALDGFQLYGRLVGAQVRSQLQYRASFALQVAGQFLGNFVGFVALLLLFHRFEDLAGWSRAEVALLYGIGGTSFGISDMLAGGFDRLSVSIQTGAFDRVLTRPVGTFAQVMASDFQLRRTGRIAQGVVALVCALAWLDVEWTAAKALVLLSAIVSGTVIFGAIWVIGAAITFWTVQTSEVTNVFTYGGEELVSYPMPIYGEGLRRFFTVVVPLAFVTYLPALFILDKPDPLGLPPWLQPCSPLVAALFFLVARGAWALGVRHYQGTGS
jgi:ABC-2 type transport system permease protein